MTAVFHSLDRSQGVTHTVLRSIIFILFLVFALFVAHIIDIFHVYIVLIGSQFFRYFFFLISFLCKTDANYFDMVL